MVSTPKIPRPFIGADFDLLTCIRAMDGWVYPERLGNQEELDRLVAEGELEFWPSKGLYRY